MLVVVVAVNAAPEEHDNLRWFGPSELADLTTAHPASLSSILPPSKSQPSSRYEPSAHRCAGGRGRRLDGRSPAANSLGVMPSYVELFRHLRAGVSFMAVKTDKWVHPTCWWLGCRTAPRPPQSENLRPAPRERAR